MSQWFKFLANDAISYLNINKNKITNNSIEIFNRYLHKKCNGKGLVIIYELTESIKEEFNEKEYKLISEEKKLSKIKNLKNKNSKNNYDKKII